MSFYSVLLSEIPHVLHVCVEGLKNYMARIEKYYKIKKR
jgi:hypothetical protein